MKHLALIFAILISTLSQAQITPIVDIQFSTTGPSPLDGMQVTTEGVVVASGEENNLDAVFIQQEGESEWAGIQLKGSLELINLKIGDKIVVDGTVRELSGLTTLDFITNISVVDSGIVILPVKVDPGIFTSYSLQENEKFECMFVQLELLPDSIYVVNQNPDAPGLNFGDYRLGANPSDPDTGCRVLAGRQTSNDFSSLNVSYVNSTIWATNSGTMNVPVIVVEIGDVFSAVRGIIVYGFGHMRLLPRNNDDFNPGDVSSGIRDQRKNQMKILIFPNPSFEDLWLSLESNKNDNVRLNIYDLSGRRVQSFAVQIHPGSNEIHKSIASFSNGIYIVEVKGEKTWASGKVVKRGG